MSKPSPKVVKENLMEKFAPYAFPVVALLVVAFLSFRWYRMKTERNEEIKQFAQGVQIENLTDEELDSVLKGANDLQTVNMVGADEFNGQVRYEFKDGRVLFTVNADLPELKVGTYQAWLKSLDKNDYRKAFTLEMGKAGFYGSAALSEEVLPFEVVVTKELNPSDDVTEEVLLTGVISK